MRKSTRGNIVAYATDSASSPTVICSTWRPATSTAPALCGCSEKRTREGGSGSNRTVGASGEMNVPISREEVVPPTEFESVPPA